MEAESIFKAPMVVGYKGEIGRFILAGLLEHLPKANDIHCTDVSNTKQDVIDRLERADYVFLCVPLQHTVQWLKEFAPHLSGKAIVEQCSIKSFLYEDHSFDGLKLLSMHLLFRPSATPVQDRHGLAFSDRVSWSELDSFCRETEKAFVTPMTLLESTDEPAHVLHDKLMARQQALVHRVLLTLAESLSEENMRTYVGKRVAELAQRIRAGDTTLYRMIQENPHLHEELRAFENRLRDFEAGKSR